MTRQQVRRQRTAHLAFESLERRRLMVSSHSFVGGVLTIDGDGNANNIVVDVELSGGVLYAKATDGGVAFLDKTHGVVAAQVEELNVNGLGDNDTINLAFVDDWTYPELEQDSVDDWDVIVEGGSGADKITGSSHNDRLYGSGLAAQDLANDLIIGGPGDDRVIS